MDAQRQKYLAGITEAKVETVDGTNCANCQFTKGQKAVEVKDAKKELNKQGGTKPENDEQMKFAKEGDLVTMPGTEMATHKVMCNHSKIKQYVTKRMCCAYWDAPNTLRAYGKQALGQGN